MECARTPTYKHTCVCANNLSQVATAKKTHTHRHHRLHRPGMLLALPRLICVHAGALCGRKNGTTLALGVRTVLESLHAIAVGMHAY